MYKCWLTGDLCRVHQAVNLDEERSIGVRLYLDHVLGSSIGHWTTDIVRGQEDFPETALAWKVK